MSEPTGGAVNATRDRASRIAVGTAAAPTPEGDPMLPTRRRPLADFRLMRRTGVEQWYGEVMHAWQSLHGETGSGGPPQWRNLGYWTDETRSMTGASRNLAVKLADAAGVEAGCDVLDVGCGPGESTYLLQQRLASDGAARGRLVGMDITQRHVDMALARRTGDSPEFVRGDATDVPFPAESFDRVLALECAFHFPDRRAFFAEALRVLRPGGRVGLADVVPTASADAMRRRTRRLLPGPLRSRLDRYIGDVTKTPPVNLVPAREYAGQLRSAGFTDVTVEDISERVFPHFARHWERVSRSDRPEKILRRDADLVTADARAKAWRRQMDMFVSSWRMSEYLIVTARKPKSA
ncbi:class I SAM-dependent methyltransferase [Salinispora arenicola]|uniref:class I SAM-dependent methyltransferase n=2 Tax=Salinispora arenicola TaxID=168697 RepID=UPI0003614EA4|nr:class I SAM-dependent methyltransferase [Salinispora arenicola]